MGGCHPWGHPLLHHLVVLIVTRASVHVFVEVADLNRGPWGGGSPPLWVQQDEAQCGKENRSAFSYCDTQKLLGHRDCHQALCWDAGSQRRGLSWLSSSPAGQKATGCHH